MTGGLQMDQADIRTRQHVQKQFELLRRPEGDKRRALADLFSGLNYRVLPDLPPPIASTEWSEAARGVISDEAPFGPAIIAEGGGGTLDLDFGESAQPGFKIIYVPIRKGETRAAPLRLTDERLIVDQLMREERHPEALLVFSDPEQQYWHFINVRRVSQAEAERSGLPQRRLLRRIAVGPEDKLGTAVRRFAQIALPPDMADAATAQQIQERHDHAFNVERLTDQFFAGFKQQFFSLEEALLAQVDDRQWAHDYALRLLSRLMFVYFIQRKRWIADDPDFMTGYWHTYLDATGGDGTFFEGWLKPLFFGAFGSPEDKNRTIPKLTHIPADLRNALQHDTPYLNGGLFSPVPDLDGKYEREFEVGDEYFDRLLHRPDDAAHEPGFLEAHNFTISEDSPLDQEVAVDPEMIGRVYESLVNISEPGGEAAGDREKQRQAGIFYTPRTEIDLMCRLAVHDYLRNHLGEEHRDRLYEMLFSFEVEEKQEADERIQAAGLWPDILDHLQRVTVVDPACGSGSFLIGMLNVLYDLRDRARAHLPEDADSDRSEADIKRDIVRRNLYGVDVMEWACHVAELRLWLQLAIHAEYSREELINPPPILPNLSFKIRQGDSLVQELGGIHLPSIADDPNIRERTRALWEDLLQAKRDFFEGESTLSEGQLLAQERNVFLQICADEEARLQERIRAIVRRLGQTTRTLEGEQQHEIRGKRRVALDAEQQALAKQLGNIQRGHIALRETKGTPFVWTVAFMDVFGGEDQGFDIVVGNPPYVRQEKISDPQGPPNQSVAARGEYKRKLQRSVYTAYPEYFGDPGRPTVAIGARSDLYVYFYFHALSLLNSRGAFCFVTSNSWLDVGYGKELQEFLARQVPMHMILDNQVKRSFANADVNTVIALFGAPREEKDACIDHTARFVMAQVPFEQLLHPVLMMEIDEAEARREEQEYRVFPRSGRELLEAGMEVDEEKKGTGPLIKVGSYGGDKWGGKYLRAPEIYWEILERAGDRLVPLGEIADVRRGFTTGANEFFFLPSRHFDVEPDGDHFVLIPLQDTSPSGIRIEARYIRRVLRSPRGAYSITPPADAYDLMFWCHESRTHLRGSRALDYIRFGEDQGYNKGSTVRNRSEWYGLPRQSPASLIWPRAFFERMMTYYVPDGAYASDRFFTINASEDDGLHLFMNTLMPYLWVELCGMLCNHGGIDTKVVLLQDIPVPIAIRRTPRIDQLFDHLTRRPVALVADEVQREDRIEFDRAVLAQIGLDEASVGDLHQYVASSAHERIIKARRQPTRQGRTSA